MLSLLFFAHLAGSLFLCCSRSQIGDLYTLPCFCGIRGIKKINWQFQVTNKTIADFYSLRPISPASRRLGDLCLFNQFIEQWSGQCFHLHKFPDCFYKSFPSYLHSFRFTELLLHSTDSLFKRFPFRVIFMGLFHKPFIGYLSGRIIMMQAE